MQSKTLCKICNTPCKHVFNKIIMTKYHNIKYYKCPNCGFLSPETPFWVEESYQKEAISIDPDRLKRNIYVKNLIMKLIKNFYTDDISILDFAGGEGLLTRFLRDENYNIFNYDKYSESLYSYEYNIKDLNKNYDLIISSEVLEHFSAPDEELGKILQYTDNYFFTTCIQPENDLENWFYLIPDNGQHISFYTTNSLAYLAEKYNMNFYSDLWWCHLFTKKDLGDDFTIILPDQIVRQKLEFKIFHRMSFVSNSNNALKKNLSKTGRKSFKKYRILILCTSGG